MSIVRRSSGSRNERSDRRGTSALGTCGGGENRPIADLGDEATRIELSRLSLVSQRWGDAISDRLVSKA